MTADALDDTGMNRPSRKSPFPPNAVSIDREGHAWVLRSTPHDDPLARYDLFDANARLVQRVVLPARTSLAGFGRKAVYLARTDDDDLRFLQRHAMP